MFLVGYPDSTRDYLKFNLSFPPSIHRAYTIDGVEVNNFHYFSVFIDYKLNDYKKTASKNEMNYLSCNSDGGGKDFYFKGICFLPNQKTLRIWGGNDTVSNQYVDRTWWKHQNPCTTNEFHVLFVEWVKKPKQSYSQLWVDGSYEILQRMTNLHVNRKEDDDFAPQDSIAAMKFYTGMNGKSYNVNVMSRV